MNYSNKNILSLIVLLTLPTIKLFGALEGPESWKTNFINYGKETIKAHPYRYTLGSLALLSGVIYGANPKVRSAVNNGFSKTVNFIKEKAQSLYNRAQGLNKKTIALGAGAIGLTVAGAKGLKPFNKNIVAPFTKYYNLKPSDLNNLLNVPQQYPYATTIAILSGLGIAGKLLYDKVKSRNAEAVNSKPLDNQLSNDLRVQFLGNLNSSVMEYIVDNGLGDKNLAELKNNEVLYSMLDEREKTLLNQSINLFKE